MKRCIAILLTLLLSVACTVCGVEAETAAAPDLIVTEIAWNGDGQVQPNTALNFKVTVKNQGTAAVEKPFTVDIGFGTDVLFQLEHTGGLAVGKSVTLTSPAWTAKSGDRMVTARVNSTKTVTEQEEWDNDTLQRNLRIAKDRYTPTHDAVQDAVTDAGVFDLTFNEDFNSVSEFDAEGTGREGYKWYIHRHSALPNLKPEEYRAKDGILTMDCQTGYFAIGATTIDRLSGIGYTYTHGYLEFRLRMPVAAEMEAGKTAIWSFPRERYAETEDFVTHVEMDWMEYYGGNYFTTTLHEQHWVSGGTDWYSNANSSYHGLGDEEWHVMGFLWEEGCLRAYLDGELYMTQTWGPDELPMPIHKIRQGTIRNEGVFSYADTQDMMLFIFGSQATPLELDYVRIWQYGGEAPPAPTTTATTTTTTSKATTKRTTSTTAKVTSTTKPLAVPTATTTTSTANTTTTAATTKTTTTAVVSDPTSTTASTTITTEATTSTVISETDETAVATTTTTTTAPTPVPTQKKHGWLWAVIPLGALLLGGGVFLLLRKK